MRTTLDIEDDVLHAAKDIARRTQRTAGQVLSELARQALTGAPASAGGVSEAPAFYGFQALPAGGRVVSDETVERLREQEGV